MGVRSIASVRQPAFTPTKLLEKTLLTTFSEFYQPSARMRRRMRDILKSILRPRISGSRAAKRSRELHGQRIVRVEPRIPIGSFVARRKGLAKFFLITHVE